MTHRSLDGEWKLTAVSGQAPDDLRGVAIPAVVPGCAHTDLLRAGLIDAPFDGDNEAAQQWIGSTVWRYERTFDWTPDEHERHDLVAEGLDTLATVIVNGTVVAQTRNQHRSYRLPIGHLLVAGENTIAVEFEAPVDAAERLEAENGGPLPRVNHHPYNALRKNASNFGWDWGIDVATSGIWRPIGIESWSRVRIDSVRPLVDVAGTTGVLRTHVALQQHGVPHDVPVTVAVSRAGSTVTASGVVRHDGEIVAVVPDVELWWPLGHGEQPLYEVTVTAGDSRWEGRVGFRTLELDTRPDEHGHRFVLRVNGEPVWIRGANWIPDHAFLTEMTPERYSRRIDDAIDANMNLLRVWGGGIYESEDFYRLCDERGVLVWQDFLLACAAYAEEEWLSTEIEAEAREAVTRLSPHASLVIWNGNNENIVAYADWGWRDDLKGRTWGDGYYRRIFPGILAELDPTRPYTPGSPFSFDDYLRPNEDADGTVHIWDVWNQKDYTAYREWRPRFVAEFGFQGPPAWTTLTDVVHDEPLDPYGHQMLVHQKAHEGNLKLARGMAGHLPEPATIDDWHFATQLNQAHAIRFGIEYFRSLTPYNTGCIVWQLNDDWPVVSWAAVDFEERRKPLWFALREAYRPRLVTVQPSEQGPTLVLVNDTAEPWTGEIVFERVGFGGERMAEAALPAEVGARSTLVVAIPADLATAGDAGTEVLVATAPDFGRAIHDFAEVIDQRLDADPFETRVEPTATGARLTVTARSYVRDIVVLADRAHRSASVDASLVSLLPGESAVFELTADGPLEADAVTSPLVLRHAGRLGASQTARDEQSLADASV
ncbi:beta-mannosidase [Diaminobutyricimonas aerilata]|uniref:beta-mannosidase n=1 Tax=Diaminobutyricimonas aerilata TaxID=1162967 RepID=A0A2M9CNA3_9MICO|nr:beta-mannosidase [Diaminobutyricimonas aerilata]PJJ73385.1 beta-mannosidase [Diaminobutyricimonas aerilata]